MHWHSDVDAVDPTDVTLIANVLVAVTPPLTEPSATVIVIVYPLALVAC
jgi:hypothetical protein